jgi:hypothetical protein
MKHNERLRIQVETGVSLPTITKWDKGQKCNPVLAERVAKEAKKLGFEREFDGAAPAEG